MTSFVQCYSSRIPDLGRGLVKFGLRTVLSSVNGRLHLIIEMGLDEVDVYERGPKCVIEDHKPEIKRATCTGILF